MAALGDFAKMTAAQRTAWYQGHECHPTLDGPASRLDRVAWLKEEHKKQPFSSFLDIGCHDGFTSRWLLREPNFNFLVGIDPCVAAIRAASKILLELSYPDKACYIAAGFEEVNIGTAFSGVSLFETLEHFTPSQVTQAVAFVYSHLRPGGSAYFCTPHVDRRWGRINPDPTHINLFDEEGLREAICSCLREAFSVEVALNVFSKGDFIYAEFSRPADHALTRKVGIPVLPEYVA